MNNEFKEGDVVSLKSGGPDMTIEQYPCYEYGVEDKGKADCIWFENKKICRDRFPLVILEKSEEL